MRDANYCERSQNNIKAAENKILSMLTISAGR